MKKWLDSRLSGLGWLERTLLLAPVIIWFSYLPNFHLWRTDTMNVEFSLVVIYCCVVALLGLPRWWSQRHWLWCQPLVWLTLLFVLWNWLGIVWSVNPGRSLLTAGLWSVLWLDGLAILSARQPSRLWPLFARVLVGAATVMSLVALGQVAYGAWFDWGLCQGCLAAGFGFVRPSGWAIEPQFFGSLLLAPIVYQGYVCMWRSGDWRQWAVWLLMMMALYTTLSRGAMLAAAIGLLAVVLLGRGRGRRLPVRLGQVLSVALAAGVLGMAWHALFTQFNPRLADTGYDAVVKSVHQLSLGRLQLPKAAPANPSPTTTTPPPASTPVPPGSVYLGNSTDPPRAQFDGYVARSTTERTGLSALALQTWRQGGWAALYGVGAGGAGRAIASHTGQIRPFEIVQNEYLALLLEVGVIGLGSWLAVLVAWCWSCRRQRWLWALLLAYLAQWLFFAGLPNALHVYLLLAVAASWAYPRPKGKQGGDFQRSNALHPAPNTLQ